MMNANSQSIRQVPLSFLTVGEISARSIYDSEGKHMLLPAGSMLDEAQFKKIAANCIGGFLYVTRKPGEKAEWVAQEATAAEDVNTVNKQLEDQTGYTAVRESTIDLLHEVSDHAQIPEDMVHSICDNVAYQVREIKPDVLFDLIHALAPVDEYLQRHIINVGMMNGLVGKWLDYSQEDINELILAGLLHDCGKLTVPPAVLNAPRRLTITEFELIKMHTVYGYRLLDAFPVHVRLVALCHHEKQNGRGYPNGRGKTDISREAAITAVSDIYDAMVSRRVYKGPVTPFTVMAQLRTLGGYELDGYLVNVFTDKLPGELIGKPVRLSDGRCGYVHGVDPGDIEHPLIRVDGEILHTKDGVYCVTML